MQKRFSHVAASLRQLCSLGLPGELLVPQFLATLEEAVDSDVHSFNWFDRGPKPVAFYSNEAEIHRYGASFANFMAGLHAQIEVDDDWVRTRDVIFDDAISSDELDGIVSGVGIPKAAQILGDIATFYKQEVLQPNRVRHTLDAPVGSSNRPYGIMHLWRDGARAYRAGERAFVVDMRRYLDFGLASPAETGLSVVEDGERGIVLLDDAGRVAQQDGGAARLRAWLLPAGSAEETAISEVFARLVRMSRGQATAVPSMAISTHHGELRLRAHWLRRPADDAPGFAAVTLSLHVPRRLKLWQTLRRQRLPARQSEVCLWFADGMTLPEISARMGISLHTAVDYLRQAYDRLDVADRETLRRRLLRE